MLVSENKTLPVAFKQPSNFTIIQSSLPEVSGFRFACLPACVPSAGRPTGRLNFPAFQQTILLSIQIILYNELRKNKKTRH